MIVIRTAEEMVRALDSPIDAGLQQCLQVQWDRLSEWSDYELSDLALFVVVQSGDKLSDIDTACGWKLVAEGELINPPELIALRGGWIEVTFILSDDGFGLVLFVSTAGGNVQELLVACDRHLRRPQ